MAGELVLFPYQIFLGAAKVSVFHIPNFLMYHCIVDLNDKHPGT